MCNDPVGGAAVIGPADLLPEVLVDRPQADVAACGQGDVLAADAGNLIDVGAAGHRIGGADAGAVDVDAASGSQPDAVAAVDGAAQVVDVLRRRHRHVTAADTPAQVLHIVARQRNALPPRNRAATVDDILRRLEGHIIARDQRALSGHLYIGGMDVHLRHQHFLRAAIGQRDGLLDQPDNVRLQFRNLRIGQRHAQRVALRLRHLYARVHQGLVLRFIAAVSGQIPLAGDLLDLALDQLLFIEPIPQLPHAGRQAQLIQHEIRRQPAARAHELRIGLHEETLRRARVDAEERIVGQRQVEVGDADAARLSLSQASFS